MYLSLSELVFSRDPPHLLIYFEALKLETLTKRERVRERDREERHRERDTERGEERNSV